MCAREAADGEDLESRTRNVVLLEELPEDDLGIPSGVYIGSVECLFGRRQRRTAR